MVIYILTLLIVICFILGVSFIYRGMVQASRLSARDFAKAKNDLAAAQLRENQLKSILESIQKKAGETQAALQQAQKFHEELNAKAQQEIIDLKSGQGQYQTQLAELDEQLQALYAKADGQAQNALDVIAALRKASEEKLSQLNISLENLKAKNQTMQDQATQGSIAVKEMEEVQKARQQEEQKLQESLARSKSLELEVAQLQAQQERIAQSQQEQLVFEQQINKLKEINNFFAQKEHLLQTELKKNRVRVLGLEKICEDFKIQLDNAAVKPRAG